MLLVYVHGVLSCPIVIVIDGFSIDPYFLL